MSNVEVKLDRGVFHCEIVIHPDSVRIRIVDVDIPVNHILGPYCDNPFETVVVASSDTDFIQSVQEYSSTERFSLYNPVKKVFVDAPQYNYVDWKCLRGDGTDNIPGIPGCGDKTALKLMTTDYPSLLQKYLAEKPGRQERFETNRTMIGFSKSPDVGQYEIFPSNPDFDLLKEHFEVCQFNSIVNDKSWKKFVGTFKTR